MSNGARRRLYTSPRGIGWGIIPLLTFAGLVSTVETLLTIIRSELNGGTGSSTPTLLLGGLCMGLTLTTALWFYGRIRSWNSAALLVAVMLVANCTPLFYRYVPPFFYQDKDLPLLGTTALYHFVFFFPACVIAFTGFALVLLPARKALRTLPAAIAFAAIATITFVYIVETQRGSWFTLLTGEPLWLLWQMTLAFFLAISLWLGQLAAGTAVSAVESAPVSSLRPSFRNGWISLCLLVVYFVALHVWTANVLRQRARDITEYQKHVKAELAQSLVDAPSRDNLPSIEEEPNEKKLVLQEIAGCTPNSGKSQVLPAESALPSLERGVQRALRPQRIIYGAGYDCGAASTFLVGAQITVYPNAVWAQYDLRHLPSPNALILYPGSIKKRNISGNAFYESGPYFYWSSGNNLVFLNGEGTRQSTIDEFLTAYLQKYPSSL